MLEVCDIFVAWARALYCLGNQLVVHCFCQENWRSKLSQIDLVRLRASRFATALYILCGGSENSSTCRMASVLLERKFRKRANHSDLTSICDTEIQPKSCKNNGNCSGRWRIRYQISGDLRHFGGPRVQLLVSPADGKLNLEDGRRRRHAQVQQSPPFGRTFDRQRD